MHGEASTARQICCCRFLELSTRTTVSRAHTSTKAIDPAKFYLAKSKRYLHLHSQILSELNSEENMKPPCQSYRKHKSGLLC